MFQQQTLLILGAGASKPYGFPLGPELINKIINCIREDTIFFPYTDNNESKILRGSSLINLDEYKMLQQNTSNFIQSLRNKNITDLKKFFKAIDNIDDLPDNILADNNVYRLSHFDDVKFVRIKLERIKELKELADVLEDFDPPSIDTFLRDHTEHSIAGKAMIFYQLIDPHNSDKFKNYITWNNKTKTEEKEDKKDKNDEHDNWYRLLLNDIKSGCKTSADILNNNLSIETFNYDVSLDYYLQEKLTKTSFFKEEHTNGFLDKLKINHIYGSICEPNCVGEFHNIRKLELDPVENDLVNLHHLLYGYFESVKENSRLKLIGERSNNLELIEKVKNADSIIFLGFGFDADNLNLLGFHKPLADYKDFLLAKQMGGIPKTKKIFYLDYKGKMEGLYSEFKELSNHVNSYYPNLEPLRIIRSTSASISHAYNDFKARILI